MDYKKLESGIVLPKIVEKEKSLVNMVRHLEVSYESDLLKFLKLVLDSHAKLISVTKYHYSGSYTPYLITYLHTEPIEMEVLC